MPDYLSLGLPDDPQDAKREMEDDLARRIPGWVSHPGSLLDQFFETVALQTARVAAAVEESALDAFVEYGEQIVREPRHVEDHAAGTVTFTASDALGAFIPVGTIIIGSDGSGGQVVFQTTQDATIPAGTLTVSDVPVEAIDPGRLASPVSGAAELGSGVDRVVGVAFDAPTSLGADGETIEEYADRLATKAQLLKFAPITPDDYDVFLRTSFAAVHRVLVRDGYRPGRNEKQSIVATGGTAGSFTLTYAGQTTAAIAYNATAGAVQSALQALANIGAGGVSVTGGPLPSTAVVVEFTGALARTNVATMTVTDSITGGDAVVTVTEEGRANAEGVAGMLTLSMVDQSGAWVGPSVAAAAATLIESVREANDVTHIVAPTITPIDVSYSVIVEDGYTASDVLSRVDAALVDYLDPSRWGQTRAGDEPAWALKRSVRMGMLSPVIGSVEGVESVQTVLAAVSGGSLATSAITLPGDAPLTRPGAITGAVA